MNKKEMFKILCDNGTSGCGKYIPITKDDIIPGRGFNQGIEYFTFFYKCPHCGAVQELNSENVNEYLSIDLQRELMLKYAGIADYVKTIWEKQKEKRDLEKKLYIINEELSNCELKCRDVFTNYGTISKLYSHWDTTDNILKKKLK